MAKYIVNPTSLYDRSAVRRSHGTIDEESGLLFVSGQTAWDIQAQAQDPTVRGQLKHALENLRTILREANPSVADLLQMRIYIRRELERHMQQVAPVLSEFFRATLTSITGIGVSSLASKRTLEEVEAVARVPRN